MPRIHSKPSSRSGIATLSVLVVVLFLTGIILIAAEHRQVTASASAATDRGTITASATRQATVVASLNSIQATSLQPFSLATGDFDEDGTPDLISGYGIDRGGVLRLQRGNVDALWPNSPAARQHKSLNQSGQTNVPVSFLAAGFWIVAPVAPEFMGVGDFNADSHLDLVIATRQSGDLYFLFGDGKGNFSAPEPMHLSGLVTALIAGEVNRADGLADIAVGVAGDSGPQVLILEDPRGARAATPEIIRLSAPATTLALDQLTNDSFVDLAIGAGHELMIVEGRDRKLTYLPTRQAQVAGASITRRPFDSGINSLATGRFTSNLQRQIAVLTSDGAVQFVTRASGQKQTAQAGAILRSERLTAVVWPQATQLQRARVSGNSLDDLLVLDAGSHQLQLVTALRVTTRTTQAVTTAALRVRTMQQLESDPVAMLPLRLNNDARDDLVLLRKGQSEIQEIPSSPAATFVVTNTNDAGPGSLRQAILDADTNEGADLITFNIGGGGPQTIVLDDNLPSIDEAVTIDGTTQPGFNGAPIIQIQQNPNMTSQVIFGLFIAADNCVVRGLVINNIGGAGIQIQGSDNIIEGNYIGIDTAGTGAAGNSGPGIFIDGSGFNVSLDNLIGGTTVAARNVIADNFGDGIRIDGSNLPNFKPAGTATDKVLNSSTGNRVQGNYIGTDATGNAELHNNGSGVYVFAASASTIGGTGAGEGNLISGNGAILGGAEGGNRTQAIRQIGIAGIRIIGNNLDGNATGNLVQGNLIGTNSTGTADIGNTGDGVEIFSGIDNTVGGTIAAARNIIAANLAGVGITGFDASGNIVQGNYIGTDAAGTGSLGNSTDGVFVGGGDGLVDNLIGGAVAGAGNIIAHNGTDTEDGVALIRTTGTPESLGNSILGNSIFANVGLGIDLNDDGVTPNDAGDGDAGINGLQNFPVLTSARSRSASTTIQGTLNSAINTTFTVEFFANDACDPSGNGEGQNFLARTQVTTNGNGLATFSFVLPVSLATNQFITATATDPNGNSSEFSACVQVQQEIADVAIAKADTPDPVNIGGTLTWLLTVSNNGPATATNVVVTDALPAGVTFNAVTAPSPASCTTPAVGSNGTVTCTIPALAATQGNVAIQLIGTVTSAVGATITNTATVTASEFDNTPANNTATQVTNVNGADLAVSKSITAPTGLPGPGADITYQLQVTNSGPSGAGNVSLTDAVPTGTTFRSVTAPAGWSCTAPAVGATGTVTCSAQALAAQSVNAISVTVRVNSNITNGATITNTAQVSSAVPDPVAANNTATVAVQTGVATAVLNPSSRVEIGPIPAIREPSVTPASNTFTLSNTGNAGLFYTLTSLLRIGEDVTSGKITAADDRSIFGIRIITSEGEVDAPFGQELFLGAGGQTRFRVIFNPLIPMLAGKFNGVAANQALPEIVTSRLTITPRAGAALPVDLIGRVSGAAKLIHPDDPRLPPLVTLVQSGSDLTVECSVYDPNLNLSIARYEFLNNAGQRVSDEVDVRVSDAITSSQLARGQGFRIEQRFEGAGDAGIARVRVTIFDEASDTALSGGVGATQPSLANVSAASYAEFGLPHESIVAGFGAGLAPSVQGAASNPLPLTLAGTRVSIRDGAGIERPAPLFFVSPQQINYQLPAGLSPGAATVTVRNDRGIVATGAVRVTSTYPGLFTANSDGQGLAAALALRVRADGSQSYEPITRFDPALQKQVPIPIEPGTDTDQVFLVLFGTGIRHRQSSDSVSVQVGGTTVPVLYAGAQGVFAGLDQINVALPRALFGRGVAEILLLVDGRQANRVSISLGGKNNAPAAVAEDIFIRPVVTVSEFAPVLVLPPVRFQPFGSVVAPHKTAAQKEGAQR